MSWRFGSSGTPSSARYGARDSALSSAAYTIGVWVKPDDWDFGYVFGLSDKSNVSGDYTDQHLAYVTTSGTPYVDGRTHGDSGQSSPSQAANPSASNGWYPILYVITSDTSCKMYAGTELVAGVEVYSVVAPSNAMRYMYIGQASGNDTGQYAGLVAELSVWDVALDSSQRSSYAGGTSADQIAVSNLRGYWYKQGQNDSNSNVGTWPLDQAVNGGGSYVSGDHPTITYAGGYTGRRHGGIPGMNLIASRFGRGW